MQTNLINRIIIAIFIGFVLFIAVTSSASQFKVVRVSDGDTINAVSDENEIKVRLVPDPLQQPSSGRCVCAERR